MSYEKRFRGHEVKIEQRGEGESAARVIAGYGAVHYREGYSGTEYALFPDVVERMLPGAFKRVAPDDYDLTANYNHNPDYVLGRRSAGTLKVTVDEIGIRYEIEVADNPIHQFVSDAITRGDVAGSSFEFRNTVAPEWQDAPDGRSIRNVVEVDVRALGPVVDPAYLASTVGMRSLAEAAKEFETWSANNSCNERNADFVDVMLALTECAK